MATFAESTSVSSEKSQQEIQRTLRRYQADQFRYGWSHDMAVVEFAKAGRQIRFVLSMPDPRSKEFTHTPTRGTLRSAAQAEEAYEQAVRQRWRALNLVIKAKLEAVEAGISTFEAEFMAQTVLPNGQTVGDTVLPEVARAYEFNSMAPLLPAIKALSG